MKFLREHDSDMSESIVPLVSTEDFVGSFVFGHVAKKLRLQLPKIQFNSLICLGYLENINYRKRERDEAHERNRLNYPFFLLFN